MVTLFKRKNVSEELQLEEILSDIRNIMYANPNATLTQMRTFIEVLCDAVLIYESFECSDRLTLEAKINEVSCRKIFSEELCEVMHSIRKTGNYSVHSYYKSNEEIIVYIDICEKLLEALQIKYEIEKVNYNKNILKKCIKLNEGRKKNIINKEKFTLLNGESIEVPKENLNVERLTDYEDIRQKMIYQLNSMKKICNSIRLENENIDIALKKLMDNSFNIVILGEVNRGKSTLINAFLGNNILPSNILPTTSTITKILYGEEKKAIVNLNSGFQKEIELDKLIKYVTGIQESSGELIKNTEVFYPSRLCKNGYILVDTPGVNDINEQNSEITYKFIPQADAIIFLMDPDQVLTKSERTFIRTRILENNRKKIFFVLNKADNLNNETIEELKKYIKDILDELHLDSNFYVISAKKALIGKLTGTENEYLVHFKAFEAEVESFLAKQKGKPVIFNSANRLSNIAHEIIQFIYNLNKALDLKGEELNELERELNENVSKLNVSENNLFKEIDGHYDLLKNKLIDIVYSEMNSSFDNLIGRLYSMESIDDNIKEQLEEYTNRQINGWIKSRVNPILVNELNDINEKLVSLVNKETSLNHMMKAGVVFNDGIKDITISNEYELSTIYETSNVSSNDCMTFIGVGALITALVSGSILGGVIGTFFLLLSEKDNNAVTVQNYKNQIIDAINKQKGQVINKINNNIIQTIDKNYEKNKAYIRKIIEAKIKENLKLIEKAQKEKDEVMEEKGVRHKELNKYLKQLIIIYEQNKQLLV